jgi:hypothetical protein
MAKPLFGVDTHFTIPPCSATRQTFLNLKQSEIRQNYCKSGEGILYTIKVPANGTKVDKGGLKLPKLRDWKIKYSLTRDYNVVFTW